MRVYADLVLSRRVHVMNKVIHHRLAVGIFKPFDAIFSSTFQALAVGYVTGFDLLYAQPLVKREAIFHLVFVVSDAARGFMVTN